MKIGIISINMYSKGLNFACPLHTYAFQQFLLKNQIESTILDYKPVYYDNFNLRHPSDYYAERYQTLSARIPQNEEEQQYLKKHGFHFIPNVKYAMTNFSTSSNSIISKQISVTIPVSLRYLTRTLTAISVQPM